MRPKTVKLQLECQLTEKEVVAVFGVGHFEGLGVDEFVAGGGDAVGPEEIEDDLAGGFAALDAVEVGAGAEFDGETPLAESGAEVGLQVDRAVVLETGRGLEGNRTLVVVAEIIDIGSGELDEGGGCNAVGVRLDAIGDAALVVHVELGGLDHLGQVGDLGVGFAVVGRVGEAPAAPVVTNAGVVSVVGAGGVGVIGEDVGLAVDDGGIGRGEAGKSAERLDGRGDRADAPGVAAVLAEESVVGETGIENGVGAEFVVGLEAAIAAEFDLRTVDQGEGIEADGGVDRDRCGNGAGDDRGVAERVVMGRVDAVGFGVREGEAEGVF